MLKQFMRRHKRRKTADSQLRFFGGKPMFRQSLVSRIVARLRRKYGKA